MFGQKFIISYLQMKNANPLLIFMFKNLSNDTFWGFNLNHVLLLILLSNKFKTLQDSKTQNGKTHTWMLKFKLVNVFDTKDTLPICSHSHALALGCEPKAKVVEFVPSIENLWNDKHAYCLVKGFFGQLQKRDIEAQGLGGLKHGHKTNLTHIYYIHLYGYCCLWLESIKLNIRPPIRILFLLKWA